ncbi:MAG TPA: hypothetical protein QGF58_26780 [Myxococcota bacterium]|nr:hypothetical protein [Myxococcota bacterium]
METDEIYDLVVDAVRQGIREEAGGNDTRISRRMLEGRVIFEDGDGRVVKEVQAEALFKKVTGVREKLRVLEQKINNNSSLSAADKADLQAYITRSYGSLTTFNFLFREAGDSFKGTGG